MNDEMFKSFFILEHRVGIITQYLSAEMKWFGNDCYMTYRSKIS